jgi:hypothetical protein
VSRRVIPPGGHPLSPTYAPLATPAIAPRKRAEPTSPTAPNLVAVSTRAITFGAGDVVVDRGARSYRIDLTAVRPTVGTLSRSTTRSASRSTRVVEDKAGTELCKLAVAWFVVTAKKPIQPREEELLPDFRATAR